MPAIPNKIRSSILDLQVDIHRYEAGLRAKLDGMVLDLGRSLEQALDGSGLETPRTDWQRARMRALVAEAEQTIRAAFADIGEVHAEEMAGLLQVSAQGVATAINDAIGAKLMIPPKWSRDQLMALASDVLIQGAPSSDWWARQAQDLTEAFADSMRQGMLRGETVTQLRDRIMGQAIPGVNAVGKVDLRTVPVQDRGPIRQARRNAEALVRTSAITVANQAHMLAYAANADILEGVQWCSTLDPRTCPSCGALDGKRWKLGESHPIPSLHWGCRCTILPVTKSWEQLAREAGGGTRIARQLDKIQDGATRASLGGQVSSGLRYEDWLKSLPRDRQRDILGPGRQDLFEKGKIGMSDLVDQRGNPLTLAQLTSKYAPKLQDYGNLSTMPSQVEGFPIVKKALTGKKLSGAMAAWDGTNIIVNTSKQAMSYWNDVETKQKEMFAAGWLSSDNRNHVIWHELGQAKSMSQMSVWDQGMLRSMRMPQFKAIARKVSEYGATNGLEFIAETFAALRAGRTLEQDVLDMYSKLLKGIVL